MNHVSEAMEPASPPEGVKIDGDLVQPVTPSSKSKPIILHMRNQILIPAFQHCRLSHCNKLTFHMCLQIMRRSVKSRI